MMFSDGSVTMVFHPISPRSQSPNRIFNCVADRSIFSRNVIIISHQSDRIISSSSKVIGVFRFGSANQNCFFMTIFLFLGKGYFNRLNVRRFFNFVRK